MAERILVPLNPGPVLAEVFSVARDRGATVTGLWVIDTRWSVLIGDEWLVRQSVRQYFLYYLAEQEREEGKRVLDEFLEVGRREGVGVWTASRADDPAETIREISPDYDLLLLPNGGGREVRTLERAARCPVLRLDQQMAHDG